MGFFKTKEEKEREKELEKRIEELDRFPGSLEEYNSLKSEEYVIMDTGKVWKYMYLDNSRDTSLLHDLITLGCSGLIRYVPVFGTNMAPCGGYGIPVKRK